MKLLKRIFISLLILLTANLYFQNITFAEQVSTRYPVEIRHPPSEEIPTIKEKKTSGWIWLIAIGLIGGIVAAATGDGDDGDSGAGDESDTGGGGDDSETGDVDYTW